MSLSPKPRITTVIPTYRRRETLPRAILSALEQDGVDVQVRVVDNASEDGTSETVDELAGLHGGIEYIAHKSNIGALANFQFGVKNLATEYFSLLSDDDYLLPGFYARALAALDAEPSAMFWVGTTLNVDSAGRIWDARLERWTRDGLYEPPEGAFAMTNGCAPTWTGILFRTVVLEAFGFIDDQVRGPSDLDYTLRLAARYRFLVQRVPVAVFTLNPMSISATQPLDSFWPGWKKMFNNLGALQDLSAADRNRLIALVEADAGRMLFRRGLNAVAAGRHAFATSAARALRVDRDESVRSAILSILAVGCRIPLAQSLMTWLYRKLETRMVESRVALQVRHGHLIRHQ